MSRKTIESRAYKFTNSVYGAALGEVKPGSILQMLWFLRHAFRMGWNAAKSDSYAAKRKKEAN